MNNPAIVHQSKAVAFKSAAYLYILTASEDKEDGGKAIFEIEAQGIISLKKSLVTNVNGIIEYVADQLEILGVPSSECDVFDQSENFFLLPSYEIACRLIDRFVLTMRSKEDFIDWDRACDEDRAQGE